MTPADLKAWRANWHYSQAQLARAFDMTIESVSRWERGLTPCPGWLPLALETLARRRAADFLNRAQSLDAMPADRGAA